MWYLIWSHSNVVEDYEKIQNFLIDSKVEFYGSQLKYERPRKNLIKDIPMSNPIEDIKTDSLFIQLDNSKILRLNSTSIYRINIFLSDNMTIIFAIKHFLGFLVSVKNYKFNGVKWYNCQKCNYTSAMCRYNSVCAENHTTFDAKLATKKIFAVQTVFKIILPTIFKAQKF